MNSQEVIQNITARIIDLFTVKVNFWKYTWNCSGDQLGIPSNPKTQEDYRGINVPILWDAADIAGYKTNLWLSSTQARQMGGKVRNGENGTCSVIYDPLAIDSEIAKDGKCTIPTMKTFVVFNIEQIDGLEHLLLPLPKGGKVSNPILAAEKILHRSGAWIIETGLRAIYRRSDDSITLPNRHWFSTEKDFYATGLHELTHWTGHESRLDRKWGKRFGDKADAFEELVAEIGSSFLFAKLCLTGEIQHVNHINSWVEVLKQDRYVLLKAVSQAQQAFEYIYALLDVPQDEVLVEKELRVAESASVASVTTEIPKNEQPRMFVSDRLRRISKRRAASIDQGILNL